jgi:hypothetical protein
VRKVTLRGGFGCPNRDGRLGRGGCRFCSEIALLPAPGPAFGPVLDQLQAGLQALARRRNAPPDSLRILAYFQDGTATAGPLEVQASLFGQALRHPQVVALAVGTRPDCVSREAFELLGALAREKPVFLELGLQVASDPLLRAMNRNHTVAAFAEAVRQAQARRLEVVAHVILDLPGATDDDRRNTAVLLNRLQVPGVKVHNLHILCGTALEQPWRQGQVRLGSREEYCARAASFLELLDPDMIIHRLTGEGPRALMLAPEWARDKGATLRAIEHDLAARDSWQGKHRAGPPIVDARQS